MGKGESNDSPEIPDRRSHQTSPTFLWGSVCGAFSLLLTLWRCNQLIIIITRISRAQGGSTGRLFTRGVTKVRVSDADRYGTVSWEREGEGGERGGEREREREGERGGRGRERGERGEREGREIERGRERGEREGGDRKREREREIEGRERGGR